MLLQQVINFISIFIITALVVRNIPRSEYGEMALVLSYSVILNILNLAVSSILIRDYPKLTEEHVPKYMSSFYTFNAYKTGFTILVTVFIGIYFEHAYGNNLLIMILAVNTAMTICQYYIEPMQVFLSVNFKQYVITKITFATSIINILSTFGVIIWPSALFVVLKNLLVAVVTLLLFNYVFNRIVKFRIEYFNNKHLGLLIRNLKSFTIWSHLQSIFSDIIYRADILILGWLNTPFQTLGNYNVALQLSNITKIVPQIVQYHTSLSVSNISDEKKKNEVVHIFMKANFVLSVCIMLGYVAFGKFLVSVISKYQYEEIFEYGLYILGGLCLFNSFRALIAYSIVSHSIKQIALTVNLPAAVFAVAAYFVGGIYWSVRGVLVANVLISIVHSLLTVVFINRKTNFKWSYSIITEYEMAILRQFVAKIISNRTPS